MEHIHKRFPGVYALNDVSYELRAGEVHALLGENGAGKSTLIKVLGGIYHPEEGEITIEGKKVTIGGVRDAQDNGIAIIHQELVLVPHMTVAENIFLGREHGSGVLIDRKKMTEEAQALLDAQEINVDANALIKDLTIAQQQMVEIVKAISYNSKILVMDEPTSSISDKEVAFLFETMRKLTAKGVGIVYISHKMSELEEICDRVTIMRDGQYVGTKVVKETTKDDLIAMMVGRELTNYYTRDYQEAGETLLRCDNISDGPGCQLRAEKRRDCWVCRTGGRRAQRDDEMHLRPDKRLQRGRICGWKESQYPKPHRCFKIRHRSRPRGQEAGRSVPCAERAV